jgi:hypothetical protein
LAAVSRRSILVQMDPRLTWQAVETTLAERHRQAEAMAAARIREDSLRPAETLNATALTVRNRSRRRRLGFNRFGKRAQDAAA